MDRELEGLRKLIGVERSVEEISRALYYYAGELRAPVVGAMHVTCADESELECASAFQHSFVQYLLPGLKFAHQSAFRLANLGGRYEWGAVGITERHFATPESRNGHKLIVVKINSHVAVAQTSEGATYGRLDRYNTSSPCCGALDALLHGEHLPFVEPLRELFTSEGKDRIAALLDETQVDAAHRSLFAALTAARLQARQVIIDIQDHRQATPTLYLVVPCATLNREERDTEILCGFYQADRRGPQQVDSYTGLGDDPGRYRAHTEEPLRRLRIEDDESGSPRAARDHRNLVLEKMRERGPIRAPRSEHLDTIREKVRHRKHADHLYSRTILKTLLLALAEISPIPAAVVLFAEGLVGVHHAFRAHRLASEVGSSEEARRMLREIEDRIDTLEPERARAVIELLLAEHGH
ncbi:MAG: hypothetical protein ACE5GW_10105 [Planctomycetota bacterium]